jgi:hypothetical protein
MYVPNISVTGVRSPPEAIDILSKENIYFCINRSRYGLFDSSSSNTIQCSPLIEYYGTIAHTGCDNKGAQIFTGKS